jgi:hypothetical protein
VAKRNPFSRWRRLPPVFRSGQHKIPGPGEEAQRIILYLRGDILDQAETLAEKAGVPTLQEYCAQLLARAIEFERAKFHVAEVEAKHGPLVGFNEITDDPDYLAEWREQSESRELLGAKDQAAASMDRTDADELTIPVDVLDALPVEDEADLTAPENDSTSEDTEPAQSPDPLRVRIEPARYAIGPPITERIVPEVLDSSAMEVVFCHVGPGEHDPHAFLPAIRRGEPVPAGKVAELTDALDRLEHEHQGVTLLDRRLAYALHRLALESQVLLTEAWPGVFDNRMQTAIRGVQERVERILSGQDIRYYQTQEDPGSERHL